MIDQAKALRDLIRKQAERPARSTHAKPAVIAVTGGKGGVGTTTVAIHLAVAMARQADRVLLVDADPDRADLAAMCGLPADRDPVDPALTWRQLQERIVPGPDGVHVLPGSAPNPTSEPSIDRFHPRWIRTVRQAEEPFDWIVVDTGNGSSQSVRTLWETANLVLLVATPELPSILDAYASIKTLADRTTPPPIHTLVNRASQPAVAYDVHGRLARAAWRFLGFHLQSAGHVAARQDEPAGVPGDPPAPSGSATAREFAQLARILRTALNDLDRVAGLIDPPAEHAAAEPDKSPGNGNEDLSEPLVGSREKRAF